jgi:hypothetical protein
VMSAPGLQVPNLRILDIFLKCLHDTGFHWNHCP